MKRIAVAAAMMVITSASIAQAQNKASGANAAAQGITAIYSQTKGFLVATAEQIPEDKYGFQPTKDVRTVGALFAHIGPPQSSPGGVCFVTATARENRFTERMVVQR